jgi:N-acetyl-anhydromuramyl-L-alanine amidase AmpD
MMDVVSCLLDIENMTALDTGTVAELIAGTGKEHLWNSRKSSVVDTVVIHYASAMATVPDDPFGIKGILRIFITLGVSSHYIIDREGTVFLLVPEEKKAWHCGGSIMPEPDQRRAVNEFSIGIELAATPQSGFAQLQYDSCALLCADIERRRGPMTYVGHQDIAGRRAVDMGLRTEAKVDPGPLFDWPKFRGQKDQLLQKLV